MAKAAESCVDVIALLPEVEALPDGFTEGDSGVDSRPGTGSSLACQLPQSEALPDGFSEVSDELVPDSVEECHAPRENPSSPPRPEEDASAMISHLAICSPSSASSRGNGGQMVDDVAVSKEMSGFSADSRAADRGTERLRRFPVPLSRNAEANNAQEACHEHVSSVLTQEHPPANVKTAAGSERNLDSAKNKKRRLKEIKQLFDAPDKSAHEKLQILHTKCLQQVTETENAEKELASVRQKLLQENAERVALSGDLSKSDLLRQKLESLCRELQRQNKLLLDESKKIAAEEQQKRQELSTKLCNSIKEISVKLNEQGDERVRQAKENEMLREKLKHFTQQYELREEQCSHQLRTKTLEQQLLEVKLKQLQQLLVQEEAKARTYTEQISQLLITEQDLRSQLALYGDKFEQFQDTLTKSNEVFSSFKQEMEKMSKTIKSLEKENLSLKIKCQKSDVSLIELLDERSLLKKQLETTSNQKKKLEALCRILQAERKQQPHAPDSSVSLEPLQAQESSAPPAADA